MQNSKTCAFTQFQSTNVLGNESNGQQMQQRSQIQETLSNPNKLSTLYRLQINNILVSQCSLIANYPQSQQHTSLMPMEENSTDKDEIDDEFVPQCNNCIDIDSIMNPNQTEILATYSINYPPEVDQKGMPSTVTKEIDGKQYKERDETKNIPKNYIKAVFTFILENPVLIKKMLMKKRNQLETSELNQFLEHVRCEKLSKEYTIGRLRQIWLHETYGKMMRMVYAYFIRKRSLHYIYSSKIENKLSHAKYRLRMLHSLENPQEFNSFK